MTDFHFEKETHTYTLDGVVIPSLSDLLRPIVGDKYTSIINQDAVEEARQRGVLAHKETEDYDNGVGDPYASTYTEAWMKFREDTGFTPTHIEYSTYHPSLRYGTTIDRLGTLEDGSPVLVDIKTGQKAKWHPLQTAGQVRALSLHGLCDVNTTRVNVFLKKDGQYAIDTHDDPADIQNFWHIVMAQRCRSLYV